MAKTFSQSAKELNRRTLPWGTVAKRRLDEDGNSLDAAWVQKEGPPAKQEPIDG